MIRQALRAAVLVALPLIALACGQPPRGAGDTGLAAGDSLPPAPGTTVGAGAPAAGSPSEGTGPGQAGAAPAPGAGAADRTPADTIRGIVAEVGSVPVTSIVIRPRGARGVTITGPLAEEIGRAAGADVWASGRRSERGFAAERYLVRAVDGQAAIDGTLAAEGDAIYIVTPEGRRRIVRPPQALRGMIGARVWLVGDPDGRVTSYGVLREAP